MSELSSKINERIKQSLNATPCRESFGTGTVEEILERAWPHIQVLKRKKRMRKKVRKDPVRYMRGKIMYMYAVSMSSSYLRHRMAEHGFARRLFKEIL